MQKDGGPTTMHLEKRLVVTRNTSAEVPTGKRKDYSLHRIAYLVFLYNYFLFFHSMCFNFIKFAPYFILGPNSNDNKDLRVILKNLNHYNNLCMLHYELFN